MQVIGAAQGAAAQVLGAVTTATQDVVTEENKRRATAAASHALTVAQGAAAYGLDIAKDQKAKFDQLSAELKEFLEAWLKQKLQQQIERVVDKVPEVVKDSVDDPEMPGFARRGKDRIVDGVWPDFKEEIMWEVAVLLDADADASTPRGSGPDCIRAFFRYHIYPADKTIWGKLRDPVWILFMLVSLIPWAGMTPLVFLFCFLIIDKTDEYQLCLFILQFKGTQFLSHGVIRTITGFFLYLSCVTVPAKKDGHSCDESGPGIAGPFEIIMGGWILQVILIWIAFLLLPCSKEKGRKALKGKIQFEHAANHGAKGGGYMRNLMIYDIVCFVICMGILGYVISTRPKMQYDEWVAKHAFYAIQVIYGFTALPFFFLTIPVLQNVLTHAVPTAYDDYGRCVQLTGPPKPKKPRPDYTDILPLEEAGRVLDKMRSIAMGTLSGKQAASEEMTREKAEEEKRA